MNSKARNFIYIFFIIIALSGCRSVALVDRSSSLVMPDQVARKILAKYFGEEWLDAPYLKTTTNPWCKSEKILVKFFEIKMVSYLPGTFNNEVLLTDGFYVNPKITPFDGCAVVDKRYIVKVSNESDAKQITEALIALGTPIKGYVKAY